MKIVSRVLIGLGGCFAALLIFATALIVMQADFRDEHAGFVRDFMLDYSSAWDVRQVHSRVTDEFVEQISSPEGREVVALFQRFGPAREITDLSVESFYVSPGLTSAMLTCNARFENAVGRVTLQLFVVDDVPRVNGVHIETSDELPLAESPITEV